MSFNPKQPRDKTGKWIDSESIKNYKSMQKKNIKYYTDSGSSVEDKYKNLNDEQKRIAESFVAINEGRHLNEISAIYNNGGTTKDVKLYLEDRGYNPKRLDQYLDVDNYMNLATPYNGHITRLLRDDRGIFDKFNEGDTMEFDRFTSFGKEGNEFKIKGGNLFLHIEKNTRGISIEHLMPYKEEREVLINKGKYKVIRKEEGHIFLEEI